MKQLYNVYLTSEFAANDNLSFSKSVRIPFAVSKAKVTFGLFYDNAVARENDVNLCYTLRSNLMGDCGVVCTYQKYPSVTELNFKPEISIQSELLFTLIKPNGSLGTATVDGSIAIHVEFSE